MATAAPPQAGQLPSSPVTAAGNHRTARLIAIVAGLLGAALAIATPLLPVTQTTAQLNWPHFRTIVGAGIALPGAQHTAVDTLAAGAIKAFEHQQRLQRRTVDRRSQRSNGAALTCLRPCVLPVAVSAVRTHSPRM